MESISVKLKKKKTNKRILGGRKNPNVRWPTVLGRGKPAGQKSKESVSQVMDECLNYSLVFEV